MPYIVARPPRCTELVWAHRVFPPVGAGAGLENRPAGFRASVPTGRSPLTLNMTKQRTFCRWGRLAGAVGLALASWSSAWALEVGYLRLEREAGKPLRAEIPVVARGPIVAADLRARIAARETFEVAGLRYHPGLAGIQIQAKAMPHGRAVLVLEGLPVDTPRLELLLTVSDRSSLTIAEYRIDTQALGNEFPPARAGAALPGPGATRPPADGARAPTAASPATTGAATATAATPATNSATPAGTSGAPAATPPAATAPARAAPATTAPATAAPSAAAAAPVAAAAPAPATAAPGPDPRPQLKEAVAAWADAWSRRDVKAYLAAYAQDFVSADRSLSYAAWASQRRQRIVARKNIQVRVEQLELDAKGSDWVASFVQHYQGDNMRDIARKQLLLRQIGGRWLIIGEREDR